MAGPLDPRHLPPTPDSDADQVTPHAMPLHPRSAAALHSHYHPAAAIITAMPPSSSSSPYHAATRSPPTPGLGFGLAIDSPYDTPDYAFTLPPISAHATFPNIFGSSFPTLPPLRTDDVLPPSPSALSFNRNSTDAELGFISTDSSAGSSSSSLFGAYSSSTRSVTSRRSRSVGHRPQSPNGGNPAAQVPAVCCVCLQRNDKKCAEPEAAGELLACSNPRCDVVVHPDCYKLANCTPRNPGSLMRKSPVKSPRGSPASASLSLSSGRFSPYKSPAVHSRTVERSGDWQCDRCRSIRACDVRCAVCPNLHGALKQIPWSPGTWVHVVCSKYFDEAAAHADRMPGSGGSASCAGIDRAGLPRPPSFLLPANASMSSIPLTDARSSDRCYLCSHPSAAIYGSLLSCHALECHNHFHASCAHFRGIHASSCDTIYCEDHCPRKPVHQSAWATWSAELARLSQRPPAIQLPRSEPPQFIAWCKDDDTLDDVDLMMGASPDLTAAVKREILDAEPGAVAVPQPPPTPSSARRTLAPRDMSIDDDEVDSAPGSAFASSGDDETSDGAHVHTQTIEPVFVSPSTGGIVKTKPPRAGMVFVSDSSADDYDEEADEYRYDPTSKPARTTTTTRPSRAAPRSRAARTQPGGGVGRMVDHDYDGDGDNGDPLQVLANQAQRSRERMQPL
ncbi:hypothetical protein H9P43_007190 [Blastocladiella emersonii ATCC 22665]|nr:hypothetical protein H9P43_007190 [Blastocladiella emersonii ATCC 22665]